MEAKNIEVVTNGNTVYLVESNGNVKAWRLYIQGEIGNGTTIDQHTPVSIEGLSSIEEIIPSTYGYGVVFATNNIGHELVFIVSLL